MYLLAMAQFSITACAVCLPLCVSIRTAVETNILRSHTYDSVCSVEEVPTHHQFQISFAYETKGECSIANCNHHYFFRDGKSDIGLADIIVTKAHTRTCQCFVSGRYSEDGQDRELITYSSGYGIGEVNQCTAYTCWNHYATLRYLIDFRRKAATNLESPGSNNHWISQCVNSSIKRLGVSIESVKSLIQQLEKEGHQDVVHAARHLFVNEDNLGHMFARGFKLGDQVWWNDIELAVWVPGSDVKYGAEGKIVDGNAHDEYVTVQFLNSSKHNNVPVDKLSRIAPDKCFGGGFCVDDIVFFIVDFMEWPDGSKLAWSSEGVILAPCHKAPGREGETERVYVKIDSRISAMEASWLSRTKPDGHLSGNFTRGQLVYYKCETLQVEGKEPIVYGSAGVIDGPSRTNPEEDVVVTFDDKRVAVAAWALSSAPLQADLAGGLTLGDDVYYIGADEELASEGWLRYSRLGIVVAGSDRPGLVSVRFFRMRFRTELRPKLLSRELATTEFPGGWFLGSCVYLREDFHLAGGRTLLAGHKGRIAKGCDDMNRVVVKFDGTRELVNLEVDQVQDEPLPGVLHRLAWTVNVLQDVELEVSV